MQEIQYHIPALLNECIKGLNITPNGTYVDVTFGGGGHSRAIMEQLDKKGRLFGFDQDKDAEINRLDDSRFTFVRSNFAYISNFMHYHNITQIDGLMADLGVSFHHFDEAERGFSFRFGGALDMRMNTRAGVTAADVINTYEEEALARVLYLYGELKSSRRIAGAIVRGRAQKSILTIEQLLALVHPFIDRKQEKKELAQLFQALRIEVNNEMGTLQKLLENSSKLLKPGGRMVFLTYHSLEDRMVKNFMRSGNIAGEIDKDFFGRISSPFKLINNRVIVASEEEVERNPRSRSAKLRIAEKL